MSATPGACIKPGLVRGPLCHKVNLPSCAARRPLCHNVNLPSCVARRRHLIMTCDIFGTRQTNTLTLCYLLGKTSPQRRHSRVTEINTLDQITGKVIDVSRTHVPLNLIGLVQSLNSDVKAFKKVNSV